MVQKKKSIMSTLEELIEQIQEKVYITPLIAGLIFLFLFGQFVSAIGLFLIAWSKEDESKNFNTLPEVFNTQSVVLIVAGTVFVILGLVF